MNWGSARIKSLGVEKARKVKLILCIDIQNWSAQSTDTDGETDQTECRFIIDR